MCLHSLSSAGLLQEPKSATKQCEAPAKRHVMICSLYYYFYCMPTSSSTYNCVIDVCILGSFSTLNCTTTGSPATTVTWTRDGQPLTIDGHTYNMVQRVTNRAAATYDNVLIVSGPVLGSTFTCTVRNMLGSDTSSITGKFVM